MLKGNSKKQARVLSAGEGWAGVEGFVLGTLRKKERVKRNEEEHLSRLQLSQPPLDGSCQKPAISHSQNIHALESGHTHKDTHSSNF